MDEKSLIDEFREETQRLMDEMRREAELEKEVYRKYLVNCCDMLSTPAQSMETLLEPILPRQGVVALVGSSDSGKSTLLRGLAMAVASGMDEYLGFAIHQRHFRAIYVATEDDESAISALMQRQIAELNMSKHAYGRMDFIFETENLVETLDKSLTERPADLVVIDAFADLYTGPMNENNRVRSFLNVFSQLAHKHSTLFIFLHHTGKRTESLAPSKHNAIGSQGFEAKMRLMMELRPDPVRHDIRHLCLVKGNYLSEEYKHDSFELRFTAGLNFVATGERVPFALLKERSEGDEGAEVRLEQMRAMREEGMTYKQIADAFGYKSHVSVINALNKTN